MNIYIMSFAKDKNSTKQPTLTGLTPISVELKRDTSIMFPVFRVQESNYAVNYNYIYVQEWNRYYYIDNATITMGGIWELACTEDCLASWKTDIGAGTYYILRSSVVYNTDIVDDYYPAFGNCQQVTTFGTNIFPIDLSSGYYVVGIVSRAAYSDASSMGAVVYYVMDSSQMRVLLKDLLESSGWLGVPNDVSQGGMNHQLLKALYNPFQYIVSCKWYPFKPPVGGSLYYGIPYGWWNLTLDTPDGHNDGLVAQVLASTPIYEVDAEISVTQHPQAATRGYYLNSSPFRKLELVAGPFGVIPIDSNAVHTNSKLGITVRCDCISGIGTLLISSKPASGGGVDYGYLFPIHHAQMGVEIQLAQIGADDLEQLETVITGGLAVTRDIFRAAEIDTKNFINPAAAGLEFGAKSAEAAITATHAIADGMRSSVPTLQISGAQGSISGYDGSPMLLHTFYNVVDDDNAEVGRPYCAMGSPTNIGNGFYMMKRGEVSCNANSVEKNIIASYLIGGFKYE